MKNLFVAFVLIMFIGGFACKEEEEYCENCQTVTKDVVTDSVVETGSKVEYCEDELEAVETDTVSIGGDDKTYYDCE